MYEYFWRPRGADGELMIVSELLGEDLALWMERQTEFKESTARKKMVTLSETSEIESRVRLRKLYPLGVLRTTKLNRKSYPSTIRWMYW